MLHGESPIDRGSAALALARLNDRGEIALIRDSVREAATPEETALAALALVAAAPEEYRDVETALREALPGSWNFLRDIAFRSDVIGVLTAASTRAAELASAWQPFLGAVQSEK